MNVPWHECGVSFHPIKPWCGWVQIQAIAFDYSLYHGRLRPASTRHESNSQRWCSPPLSSAYGPNILLNTPNVRFQHPGVLKCFISVVSSCSLFLKLLFLASFAMLAVSLTRSRCVCVCRAIAADISSRHQGESLKFLLPAMPPDVPSTDLSMSCRGSPVCLNSMLTRKSPES